MTLIHIHVNFTFAFANVRLVRPEASLKMKVKVFHISDREGGDIPGESEEALNLFISRVTVMNVAQSSGTNVQGELLTCISIWYEEDKQSREQRLSDLEFLAQGIRRPGDLPVR